MRPDIARYEKNLREELDGSALYAALAAAEADRYARIFSCNCRKPKPGTRKCGARNSLPPASMQAIHALVPHAHPGASCTTVRPALRAAGNRGREFADRDKYSGQADASALSSEERGHAAVIQAAATSRSGGMIGADIAKAEPWHRRSSGNDLRAAVLGANDGLVSNLCLVMGVAGAGQASHTILLTGLAGLVAGAVSMALGEWLSVTMRGNSRAPRLTRRRRNSSKRRTPSARSWHSSSRRRDCRAKMRNASRPISWRQERRAGYPGSRRARHRSG